MWDRKHRTPTRERLFRRILQLPAERPDPIGIYAETPEDDPDAPYAVIKRDESEKHQRQIEAWHREDQRADWAEYMAAIFSWRSLRSRLKNRWVALDNSIYSQKSFRELTRCRHLRFTSHYVHTEGEAWMIEGYFDLPSGRSYDLSIIAASGIPHWVKQEQELFPEYPVTEANNVFFGRWIMVPGRTLNDKKIKEGLDAWYSERFRWSRGHWSNLENQLPEIEIDLSWEVPDDQS